MAALRLWLPALLVFLSQVSSAAAGSPTDAELLLNFKATFTNGDVVLQSWVGADPCITGQATWTGVNCMEGRVAKITAAGLGLRGAFPQPAGWALPDSLLVLDLNSNEITGSLPPALALPAGLEKLNLRSNKLSGTVPAELSLPASLRELNLALNQLMGTLPDTLALPEGLETFAVARNRLSGSLPTGLRLPASLKSLALDNNAFKGSIPESWKLPGSLTWMDVSNNMLTGSIPPGWDLPTSLNGNRNAGCVLTCTGLGLQNNSFSGTLPAWPSLSTMNVFITPGNKGLCGETPSAPLYFYYETDPNVIMVNQRLDTRSPLKPLPACGAQSSAAPPPPTPLGPQDDTSSGGGLSTAAVVGAVVGGLAGAAVVGLAVWRIWRRRRLGATVGGEGKPDMEKGHEPGKTDKARELKESKSFSFASEGGPFDQKLPATLAGIPQQQASPSQSNSGGTSPPLGPSLPSIDDVGAQQRDSESLEEQALLANDPLLASIVSRLSSTVGGGLERAKRVPARADSRQLVDVQLWILPFHELALRRQIGAGSFGRVYQAQWKDTIVAAKLLLGESASMANVNVAADLVLSLSSPVLSNLQQEASLMAALRHPNVLGFIGLCTAPPCLVSEYCPRGSLYDTLRDARKYPALAQELTWLVRLRIAMGAALGMQYLHSFKPGIVHRDLKSPNLLIGHNWTVKVSDFNLSKIMGENAIGSTSSVAVGNPRWLAPEVLAGDTHTFASDVYSYGLVLWELLTFEAPFEGHCNFWQVTMEIVKGCRPAIPSPDMVAGGSFEGLDAFIDLMQQCWAQEPAERPSFGAIIAELRKLLALVAKPRDGCCGDAGDVLIDSGRSFKANNDSNSNNSPSPFATEQKVYRSVRLR